MKRLTYSIPLSVVAVLLFASIALAQVNETPSIDQTQSADDQTQSAGAGVQATPVADPMIVNIHDHAFDPNPISVDPGTMVTWVNEDTDPHTVTADDGSFDSGILNPGDSYSVTFDGSGTLGYHCNIHPDMTGSVDVGGTSGSDPTSTEGTNTDPTQPANDSTQTTNDPTHTTSDSTQMPVDPAQIVSDTIDTADGLASDMSGLP
jgi:plastocyanin